MLAACHLINRTPTTLLKNKSPYEVLFGKMPSYAAVRVFGCLCYAHNQRHKGEKFESRSRKCIFVGYLFGKKGWKLYDLETHEYFVSRDVKFFEKEFPFATSRPQRVVTPVMANNEDGAWSENEDADESIVCIEGGLEEMPTLEGGSGNAMQPIQHTTLEDVCNEGLKHTEGEKNVHIDSELGRGKRTKIPSTRYHDFVTHTIQKISSSKNSPATSSFSGTPYPIAYFVNCERFSARHRNFLAAVTAGLEPKNFKEAMKYSGWRDAMSKEIRALEDNKTWVMETLPPGKKALGSQWIYKIKYRSDGSIERLKARLVIFGNHQVEGIDYNETFAPVAKMVTVRIFLAIAAVKRWEVHQMDVHNAFLHGDLSEEVYMKVPPGFKITNPDMVCRLKKSLYGLKQAPRCWFAKLSTALKNYGFVQSYSDYSLFVLCKGRTQLNVLVYVDDLIIAGNDKISLTIFKNYLGRCFHMKDLGVLKYFLGLEVARNPEGIFLCQRKYTLDIISETGLLGARPATFPMEQNHNLGLAYGAFLADPAPYRRLVGRLIYLSVTRPDLAYSVHILSQFMQQPRDAHWEAALRVVRYLKKSPGQGILLHADSDLSLKGWCDSDWASCPLTRRSLTGWFVLLGSSPVSWKTKKQNTVSRSSAEAEYRSMAATVCELKWLKQLLSDLGVQIQKL